MDDPARAYLSRVIDWTDAAAGTAWVNLHHTKQEDQDNKTSPWFGYSSQDIEVTLQQVKYFNKKGVNVFLRQSTCSQVKEAKATGGFRHAARRLQENTHRLRTFFFDLDVKKGAYATTQDAWADLYRVCAEAKLPPPQVIVLSGSGGLHVYWVLDQGITNAAWKPLAQAFIMLLEHHGLMFDRQCSADSARVLRVPGTMNWKGGSPKPVQLAYAAWIERDYTLAEMRAVLDPWIGFTPPSNVTALPGVSLAGAMHAATHGITQPITGPFGGAIQPGRSAPLPDTGEFSGGVQRAPVDMNRVIAHCAVFGEATRTGGQAHDNGLWHQLVYNATFAEPPEQGRQFAHAFSNKHSSYTVAETDAEFDRAMATRRSDSAKGWTACTTFGSLAPAHCQACPLAGKIEYPLAIGTMFGAQKASQILGPAMVSGAASGAAIQPALPVAHTLSAPAPHAAKPPIYAPYYRNDLGIWKEGKIDPKTNEKEPDFLVINHDILAARLEEHPVLGVRLIAMLQMPNGRARELIIQGSKKQAADLDAAFGHIGADLHKHQIDPARIFIVDFMAQLQRATISLSQAPSLGWVEATGTQGGVFQGFAYDGIVHGAGTPAGSGDPIVMGNYKVSGDYPTWQAAAAFVLDQGRQDLCAIVASAFAAPFVIFSGQTGLLLSAYSQDSGIGKSTAMRVAASVWAQPTSSMAAMDDTSNSVMGRVGILRNLPMLWDELKGDDAVKKFVSAVFQLAQGKGKGRMTSSAQLRDVATWQTMMVVASNNSILDFVAQADRNNEPGTLRTFEFVVSPSPIKPTPAMQVVADNILRGVNHSYGHAGLAYAKWLGSNHAKAKAAYDIVMERVLTRMGTDPQERFWVASITCLVCGAYVATQLGICKFDVPALEDFLCETMSKLRRVRTMESTTISSAPSIVAVLQDYITSIGRRHVIVTDRMVFGRGNNAMGARVQVLSDVTHLDGVRVQVAVNDQLMRIDRPAFRDWLNKQRISPRAVFDGLEKKFKARTGVALMAPGTAHAGFARIPVVTIPTSELWAAGLVSFSAYQGFLDQTKLAAPTSVAQANQTAQQGITL